MAESIFDTWVTNQRENSLIVAGYVLPPQVPIHMYFYKYSDLKTIQNYANMNIVKMNDDPATNGIIGNNILATSTPMNLNTISEIAAQMTYTKTLQTTNFSETGTGTGKWITTIEHNFGRLPDVKVISGNKTVYGDIVHDDTFNYFTLTLSQRIPCTVHLS
jgi:hypothetical protein